MAVKIQTAYLPVEVDLWGAIYVTQDLTRDESDKEAELFATALAAEDEAEAIKVWGEYLDLILKPHEHTKKPSASLKREFKADKITSRGVFGVVTQVKAAEQGESAKILQKLAAGRPT